MATPVLPGPGNPAGHSFRRYHNHDGITATTGVGGSGPSAQKPITSWAASTYADPAGYTAGDHNIPFVPLNPLPTPANVGGRGWCNNLRVPEGEGEANQLIMDGAIGHSPWIAHPAWDNLTLMFVARHPLGVSQALADRAQTMLSGGAPAIGCVSEASTAYAYGMGYSATRQFQVAMKGTGSGFTDQANVESVSNVAVRVGPEVFILQAALAGGGNRTRACIYRADQLVADVQVARPVRTSPFIPRYISDGLSDVGAIKLNSSRSVYDVFAEWGNGDISDANLKEYAQACLNAANGGVTYPDPDQAVVFITDSMGFWHSKGGVSIPGVYEARVRQNGVAVYASMFAGMRAAQLYNGGNNIIFQDIGKSSLFTNGSTFTKLTFVLCLGTNDITDSTAAATILGYIEGIAGYCRSVGTAAKVIAWVPPTSASWTTAQEDIRRALRTGLNSSALLDGVLDLDVVCPELVAEESTLKAIRYAGSSLGFQQPKEHAIILDATLGTPAIGIDAPHLGPVGMQAVGDALARMPELQSALGLVTASRKVVRPVFVYSN